MDPKDCLKTRPKSVALLGLGTSHAQYTEHLCSLGCDVPWDEVWTVNFGGKIFRHDKLWVMDDLRVQAKALPAYGDFLRRHDVPIITSTAYPEYPLAVAYPVQEVVDAIGDDFLNSTVAYATAWAMMTGVKELWLFGCDFHYPNQTRAEEGGQCQAYLLGLARYFGMKFKIPPTTTLLGAYHAKLCDTPQGKAIMRPLYGYAVQPFIKEGTDGTQPGGSPRVPEGGGEHGTPPGEDPPDRLLREGRQEPVGAGRGGLLRLRGDGEGDPRLVLGAGEAAESGAAEAARPRPA